MKISNKIYMILSFVFVMIFTTQSALAGCAIRGGGSDPLDPDPQAAGSKYSGPLVVYYDDNGTHTTDDDDDDYDDDKICWFVRLRKGADLYSFAECKDKTYDEKVLDPLEFQQDAIDLIKIYFFQQVAIPEIYDCDPRIDCPTAVLKSYNQDVGLDNGPNPIGVWDYWMMNITVAVQD